MVRARDTLSAVRIAIVWILVLIMVPLGGTSFEREQTAACCESWCPCDETEPAAAAEHDETHGDEEPQGCGEDCPGCCDARVPVAVVGHMALPSTYLGAAATGEWPPLDAPGCRVATGVFRPPRSLT